MSNLPPGVTSRDIDRHFGGPSYSHEFALEPDVAYVEDGAVIWKYSCTHREVYGSSYSAKHDERFYDEGPKCDETKTVRFDLSELYINGGSKPVDTEKWSVDTEEAFIELEIEAFHHTDGGVRSGLSGLEDDECDIEVLSIDPDKSQGEVILSKETEYGEVKAVYKP